MNLEFLDNINIILNFDEYVDYICYLVNKEFKTTATTKTEAKIIRYGKNKEMRVDICFEYPYYNWHTSLDVETFREWFEDDTKIDNVVKYTKEIITTMFKKDLIKEINKIKIWKDNNNDKNN